VNEISVARIPMAEREKNKVNPMFINAVFGNLCIEAYRQNTHTVAAAEKRNEYITAVNQNGTMITTGIKVMITILQTIAGIRFRFFLNFSLIIFSKFN
jgi:uncharacterized membrane protein